MFEPRWWRLGLVAGLAGERWWRQLAGVRSRMPVVAVASSHREWSGGAAPQAMLVVIAALAPRCDLIMGAALRVGGDMAAGVVGGGPSLVAGSRSPSRRGRVPLRDDHRAHGSSSQTQQALHTDSGWTLVVGATSANWSSISRSRH